MTNKQVQQDCRMQDKILQKFLFYILAMNNLKIKLEKELHL